MKFISRKKMVFHLLAWIIFLSLPIFISPHPPGASDYLFTPPGIRDVLANILMILFFYVNYYIIIPKLYLPKKYFLYGIWIVIAFAIIALFPSISIGYTPGKEFPAGPPMPGMHPDYHPNNSVISYLTTVNHNILLFVSVVLFSIFLRVREKLYAVQQANNEMEIKALKNQINPHFLFNTLNNLYGMAVRDQSEGTADGIMKLSGLMRYAVTESEQVYVSLNQELIYIKNYLSLQKLRLDESVILKVNIPDQPPQLRIAPLVLITFIENAFKHGINPDENSEIKISIETIGHQLELNVINRLVYSTLQDHEHSGYGLHNTKNRLHLLYPKKHSLSIQKTDTEFEVHLTLHLHD